jgi:hypothetical protein
MKPITNGSRLAQIIRPCHPLSLSAGRIAKLRLLGRPRNFAARVVIAFLPRANGQWPEISLDLEAGYLLCDAPPPPMFDRMHLLKYSPLLGHSSEMSLRIIQEQPVN